MVIIKIIHNNNNKNRLLWINGYQHHAPTNQGLVEVLSL